MRGGRPFEAELRAAKVDWQLVAFGNAVHSFTDVDAKMSGKAASNATVAARAYQMMHAFFAEALPKRRPREVSVGRGPSAE